MNPAGAPVGSGGYEGTPLTAVVVPVALVVTLVVSLIAGNLAINLLYKAKD
jgi:hypothetical protein